MGHDEPRVRERLVEVRQVQHVHRRLQPPRPRRLAPLQELQHAPLVAVRRREVGLEQPVGVRRDLREREEHLRLEVERQEVEALERTLDVGRDVMARVPIFCWLFQPSGTPGIGAASPSTAAGTASADSHMCRYRMSGSCASRNDSAVEPVRGRLRPMSGASMRSSPISGWRRYQSSTCSRWPQVPGDPRVDEALAGGVEPGLGAERTRRGSRDLRGRSRHRSRRGRSRRRPRP